MDSYKQQFLSFLDARFASKRRTLDETPQHSSYHKELSRELAELLEVKKAFLRICGGSESES